jgi:hypothetical protein
MIQLQYGINITSAEDTLQKVPLERIVQGIQHPKAKLRNQIERLRMVRTVDERQYGRLKRQLPYFVCGHFHPVQRRREHFSSIETFVVDLDHLQRAGLDKEAVRQKLQEDERTLLVFTSPSGDGLKVMFRLKERCLDAGLYSYFYKAFVQKLAVQYGLEQVVDLTTHDVSRACFLSIDPKVYYHAEASAVVLEQYFDAQSPDEVISVQKEAKKMKEQQPDPPRADREPLSDEVLLAIKQKLNPNFRPRKKKEAYVPPELETVMPVIREKLAAADIELRDTEGIHYGKKMQMAAGPHLAEINVFFGKRGFSVVKTTKTGTNPELAALCYQIIYEALMPGDENEE